MKNVLVTGGAGFLGSHVTSILSIRGYRVVVIDVSNMKFSRENITTYKEDIRNVKAIREIVKDEKIDKCLHLAAKVSVSESVSNPEETIDVNINGTRSVLDACADNGVDDFIFASSAAVYGNPLSLPVHENHTLKPVSPYGISKADGERIVTDYRIRGKIKKTISLRFFNIYGEGQNPEYAGVITKFAERLSQGLSPIIYGDGNQTRDFISVHDVVRAIVLATESQIYGTFNIGTGNTISINQLAQRMTRIFGLDLLPIYREVKAGDILHSCADIRNAQRNLQFDPNDNFESRIIRMFGEIIPKRTATIVNRNS